MRHAIVLLVLLCDARSAAACDRPGLGLYDLDPMHADDRVAPSVPSIEMVEVRPDEGDAGGCAGTSSCGEYGFIYLQVSATDDRAPADRIGFHLRHVGGTLPRGLELPDEPSDAFGGGMYLYFDDEAPPFEAEIEVRAVDLNGNMGPPSTIVIASGPHASGCSTSGNSASYVALLAAFAIVVRRRRRDVEVQG